MKSFTRFWSLFEEWFKHFITPKRRLLILDRFYWNDKKNCGHDLLLLEDKTKELKKFHLPRVTDSDMGFKMVGSCNGLICIALYSLDPTFTLFLWSPATSQIKRIMEPENTLQLVPPNCLIGFHFNSNESDYEVVRLHSFENGDRKVKIHGVRVEKYSLRNGSWREIEYDNSDGIVSLNGDLFWTENSVTVNGVLYWVAIEVSERANKEFIISFNSCNNVIGKILMPCSVTEDCCEISKRVAEHKDSVAVLSGLKNMSMEYCIEFWVLDHEYEGVECWTRLQTIGMFSGLVRPVGIWKNEVVIATEEVIQSLTGIKPLLPVHDLGVEISYGVYNYEESSVPL